MNGHVLSRVSLAKLTRHIARMTPAQRAKLPGLDPRRAGIIVPGAVTLLHVLDTLELDGITVSDFGVREGLVTDYIAHHADEVTRLAPIEDLRLRSVVQLLTKFHADGPHPRHIARLALALWDGFRRTHSWRPRPASCCITPRCCTTSARWWASTPMPSTRRT